MKADDDDDDLGDAQFGGFGEDDSLVHKQPASLKLM